MLLSFTLKNGEVNKINVSRSCQLKIKLPRRKERKKCKPHMNATKRMSRSPLHSLNLEMIKLPLETQLT